LNVTTTVSGGAVTVTSTYGGGVGPYQFLFDCELDGNWNGVVNTSQPTAEHTCTFAPGTHDLKAWAWDQGANTQQEEIVTVSVN
jgi:hypothetical protein